METKYYVLVRESCSLRVLGPFSSLEKQEAAARRVHAHLAEDGLVFWAEVVEGCLEAGDYSGGFFNHETGMLPSLPGQPRCRDKGTEGRSLDLVCTRTKGHEGDHVAHGFSSSQPIATWPKTDGGDKQ